MCLARGLKTRLKVLPQPLYTRPVLLEPHFREEPLQALPFSRHQAPRLVELALKMLDALPESPDCVVRA